MGVGLNKVTALDEHRFTDWLRVSHTEHEAKEIRPAAA